MLLKKGNKEKKRKSLGKQLENKRRREQEKKGRKEDEVAGEGIEKEREEEKGERTGGDIQKRNRSNRGD